MRGGGQLLAAESAESSADSSKSSGVYDLGKIEITTQDTPDSNATASVITAQDIANTGSNNIAEALRFTPGVFYRPYGTGQRGEPGISVRGFNRGQIGFFLDGIPVHSIYDRNTDWSQFSSFGLSEISISKGYTSPQYGMNTMGGAINMVTSKPMKPFELGLKYGFISNNEHLASVSVGSNLGKYYIQATYAFQTRDSYPLSNKFKTTTNQPNREAVNSYYTNHTARLKLGFEPNENHEYSLNLIYERGEKGGIVSATSSSQFWKWPHYDKVTAYVLGRSQLSDSLKLNSRIYYDHFYNILDIYDSYSGTIPTTRSSSSKYDDHTFGLIETLEIDFNEKSNLKVGLNLRQDNHNNYDPSKVADPETKLSDLSTSIFAEYAQRFNDTLRAIVSASYDRNDMLRAIIKGGNDKKYSLQGGSAQAIIYADWNDSVTSWFNVGYKSSLPTLRNRYSRVWGTTTPNPNLQPESAINVELGSKFSNYTDLGTTNAQIALFYNDLTNMVYSATDTTNSCINGTGCTKYTNARSGYSYGVELGFTQGFWRDRIKFGANYTYQQKQITNKGDSDYALDGRILDYPNHIANANLTITPVAPLDVIANATFQSAQWVADYSRNNRTYTGYHKNMDVFLLDLKLNYRVIDGLQLSVGAYNLLDKLYYYNEGYYMPGRRIFASVEYRF